MPDDKDTKNTQSKPEVTQEPKSEPKSQPGVYLVNGKLMDANGKPVKD